MESSSPSTLNNPNLFEVNTAVFLGRLRENYNREITLGTIPHEVWKSLVGSGFNLLWCMGVWERSKESKTSALSDTGLRKDYEKALPGWTEDDVIGSPYAIYSYRPDPRFGTEDDLKKLKDSLNKEGIGLILDFVPNHLALDHPWTVSNPEYFIQKKTSKKGSNPDMFFATEKGDLLAHGRDPYFPPWKDTVQINHFSSEARTAMIDTLMGIARHADGVRCDMAMLVLNSVFEKTWAPFLKGCKPPAGEFWKEAIETVKERFPSFLFIAEAYWDLEWRLQELGFDYTYDKKLYDLLLHAPARKVHEHLWAGESYQKKSVRFIENHDEPRAVTAFGRERLAAAAVVAATVPGMHFFHEGQLEGTSRRLPVQLGRRLQENPDSGIQTFYKRLLDYIKHELVHSGTWELMDPAPAWETNPTYRNLLAWIWYKKNRFRLIVVNYSNEHSQGIVYLPENLIQKHTMVFHDCLRDASYARQPSDLVKYGLYIDLHPWQAHLFEIEPS